VTVPGSDGGGAIDGEALKAWVKQARKLCADAGRGEIGDERIGEILSASVREPDQPWPPEPLARTFQNNMALRSTKTALTVLLQHI
jgi:hypothetical protein